MMKAIQMAVVVIFFFLPFFGIFILLSFLFRRLALNSQLSTRHVSFERVERLRRENDFEAHCTYL